MNGANPKHSASQFHIKVSNEELSDMGPDSPDFPLKISPKRVSISNGKVKVRRKSQSMTDIPKSEKPKHVYLAKRVKKEDRKLKLFCFGL